MTKTAEQLTKVDKDVPFSQADANALLARCAKNLRTRPHKRSLPFMELEVGDSFIVPSTQTSKNMRSRAAVESFRLHKRFMFGMDANKVRRVWRIS